MKNALIQIVLFHFLSASMNGQMLNANSERLVSLQDGTTVLIYRSVNEPAAYYYVPRKIQVSCAKGVPEISLMVYSNEKQEITGGILHVLMTWGLTQNQEKEIQNIITHRIDSLGTLRGAAEITLQNGQLEFDQQNVFAKGLEKSSNMTIKLPARPEHKTAASFNLSPLVARFLVEELNSADQSKEIYMRSAYRYTVSYGDGGLRTGEELKGEMITSLATWIRALKRYRLIKKVTI